MLTKERVLARSLLYIIAGILFGMVYTDVYIPFFICLLFCGGYYFITKNISVFVYGIIFTIAFMFTFNHPLSKMQLFWQNYPSATVQGTITEVRQTSYSTVLTIDSVILVSENGSTEFVNGKLDLTLPDPLAATEFSKYDIIYCKITIDPPATTFNPADFVYSQYLKSEGIVATAELDNIINYQKQTPFIEKVQTACDDHIATIFADDTTGIIKALILGDKSSLDDSIYADFQNLGISHILVISGFHLGAIYLIAKTIASYICPNYYARLVAALLFIWSYCLIANFTVSITRAATLITVTIIAFMIREESDFFTSLALAAIIILIDNPFALTSASFLLSFATVTVIGVYNIVSEHYLDQNDLYTLKYKSLIFSASITLGIAPIIIYLFYQTSLAGIILNLALIPVFSIIIYATLFTLAVGMVSIDIAQYLANFIIFTLESISALLEFVSEYFAFAMVTLGKIPVYAVVICYAVIGTAVVAYIYQKDKILKISIAFGVCTATIAFGCGFIPSTNFELTQLYVGQGDCTIIQTSKDKIILVDAGPPSAKTKVMNHIKYLGNNNVELAIVTHSDSDHIGGVIELFKAGMDIDILMLPYTETADALTTEALTLAADNDTTVIYASSDSAFTIDNIAFNIISPHKTVSYENLNEASMVFTIQYKDFTMLFTGDIGHPTEMLLLDKLTDVDVLKVGHHGSKNSSSAAFIAQCSPEIAFISSGKNNLYQHPHSDTLDTLDAANVTVFRTDLQGAITIDSDFNITTHLAN
ncbi:DNA internalization-related competence protein ComEC/Rec2 [Candidatus Epulonipiscium viviparus]|uniref:DNA internalization-related competence protein ComEC/Rec2 n=1 Tax=Candidatus Epulonipiscium viviparus TaxID=420336 RepID=UPI002738089D|nr:DNA internalization-related competence protein ComEC/Rec2 [Candidatus Epulopiscium viviparus]